MISVETSYGIKKRFQFAQDTIERSAPGAVLDVGCGTGNQLTRPLAAMFSSISFVGVDSDTASIRYAQKTNAFSNLRFYSDLTSIDKERFDLIIASEVIEHVKDPATFLTGLRDRLSDRGMILITLPNGRGPFEMATLLFNLLRLTGITRFVRKAIATFVPDRPAAHPTVDSFALSPHINFFTFRQICSLYSQTGLSIVSYRPRTLFCGPGLDLLVLGRHLIDLNARLSDRLPPCFSSDWMFLLQRTSPRPEGIRSPGAFAALQRSLSLKANTPSGTARDNVHHSSCATFYAVSVSPYESTAALKRNAS